MNNYETRLLGDKGYILGELETHNYFDVVSYLNKQDCEYIQYVATKLTNKPFGGYHIEYSINAIIKWHCEGQPSVIDELLSMNIEDLESKIIDIENDLIRNFPTTYDYCSIGLSLGLNNEDAQKFKDTIFDIFEDEGFTKTLDNFYNDLIGEFEEDFNGSMYEIKTHGLTNGVLTNRFDSMVEDLRCTYNKYLDLFTYDNENLLYTRFNGWVESVLLQNYLYLVVDALEFINQK